MTEPVGGGRVCGLWARASHPKASIGKQVSKGPTSEIVRNLDAALKKNKDQSQ
jgi:hypothetical protein